jgi:hypothetical protein
VPRSVTFKSCAGAEPARATLASNSKTLINHECLRDAGFTRRSPQGDDEALESLKRESIFIILPPAKYVQSNSEAAYAWFDLRILVLNNTQAHPD